MSYATWIFVSMTAIHFDGRQASTGTFFLTLFPSVDFRKEPRRTVPVDYIKSSLLAGGSGSRELSITYFGFSPRI